MKNELTVKDEGLLQVIESRELGDMIKPLINEIHLFDTFIAGTAFVPDPTVFEQLNEGDRLKLRREENKFDEKAILILNEDGAKLGYVPEKDNLVFSRLMDAGKMLAAKVTNISKRNSFYQISIGIYLVDF